MKKNTKKSKARIPHETGLKDENAAGRGGKEAQPDDPNTEDGRMDFGGLPNRDLKKNLGGCG